MAHAELVEANRVAWIEVDKIKVKESAVMNEMNAKEEIQERLAAKLGLIEEERDRARQVAPRPLVRRGTTPRLK